MSESFSGICVLVCTCWKLNDPLGPVQSIWDSLSSGSPPGESSCLGVKRLRLLGVERAALQHYLPDCSAVFESQLGLVKGGVAVMGGKGGGSHEVMLSLSEKQQKQGPAEIACCLSTFLA